MIHWQKGQVEKHTQESWLQGKLLTWFTCRDCLAHIPNYPAPCQCQGVQAAKEEERKTKQATFYASKKHEKMEQKQVQAEARADTIPAKRGSGRPKGSKNKPKRR